MLPGISDFLKSTFDESLKKLIQPNGLIPAAIFLLLNLLLIFLPIADADYNAVAWFYALSDPWKLVIGTALLLVLGYLLASLSSSLLKVMTGELWANSLFFGPWLSNSFRSKRDEVSRDLKQQRQERDRLAADAARVETECDEQAKRIARTKAEIALLKNYIHPNLAEIDQKLDLLKTDEEERPALLAALEDARMQLDQVRARYSEAYRLRTLNYPEQQYIAPTDLGNAVNVTSDYIYNRYGIEMAALWTQMENIVADDKPLQARLDNEKAALDFMVNLSVLLDLFALEFLLVRVWLGEFPSAAGGALVFLVLGYAVYRVAVTKARSWGDAVQCAFDLHREDLRKKMRVREFRGLTDERAVWEKLSGWLMWGKPFPENVFEASAPAVSTVCSENIKVSLDSAVEGEARVPPLGAAPKVEYAPLVRYMLLVNNPAAGQTPVAADGAHVIITDTRVPRIDTLPQITNPAEWAGIPIAATVLTSGKPKPKHKLLWTMGKLPPASCRALQYALPGAPVFTAAVTTVEPKGAALTLDDQARSVDGYTLELLNCGAAKIDAAEIHVSDDRMGDRHELTGTLVDAKGTARIIHPAFDLDTGVQTWFLRDLDLDPNARLTLVCEYRPQTE